jgi:hypothetical protein
MKKGTRITLIIGLVSLIAAVAVWKFVNKPVNDYSTRKASHHFSFADIISKVSNDTASLIELKDKLVSIDAKLKNVNSEGESLTLELGDSSSMSSVICQVDKRHIKDFADFKPGADIAIQGIITGYTIDTDLGLGNTIEMTFCTLKK